MIKLKNFFQTLAESSKKQINQLEVSETIKMHSNKMNGFIKIRDIKEIKKYKRISANKNIPKGKLECWTNSNSPYHKKKFNKNINFIFNCIFDFRSTLTTLKINNIGLLNTSHFISGLNYKVQLKRLIDFK